MTQIFYTRCSKCKIDKYTNPVSYAKRKKELKGVEEKVDNTDNMILTKTSYVCRDCKKESK